MSINRKRSKTRTTASYLDETHLDDYLDVRKPRPILLQRKKYTFGLPPELTRSPVHAFYKDV